MENIEGEEQRVSQAIQEVVNMSDDDYSMPDDDEPVNIDMIGEKNVV